MLRICSIFAITIAALMTAFPAQAVFGDTRPAELATADKGLNATYAALMKQLRKEEQEKLKKAQRIWISLREADCKWANAAEPLDCMIDRTLHRTEELKGSMFWAPNGEYTSLDLQKK
jgi:uncharacterized protein YecT (DUF1311 family)